jgi:hypothetical protein
MRQRGISTIATVIIAATAALLIAPLFMGFVIVDVNVKGPERHHIIVPVPLGPARAVMALLPRGRVACEVPGELAKHRAEISSALDTLASCGDTTLVSVRSPKTTVRIATARGALCLDVEERDTSVHGSFRIEAVRNFLAHWDGRRLEGRAALDLVAGLGRGELLSVRSREADVSLKLW